MKLCPEYVFIYLCSVKYWLSKEVFKNSGVRRNIRRINRQSNHKTQAQMIYLADTFKEKIYDREINSYRPHSSLVSKKSHRPTSLIILNKK